jgi:hypothetical protein
MKMIRQRRMKLASDVARLTENRNAYKVSVENPEGKIPIGRHKIFRNRVRKVIINGMK